MEVIKSLGEILANNINISPTAARGLIKLAIKDELGPFTDLNRINYENLQSTIQNSLKKRLKNLTLKNLDMITESLLIHLKEIQSLITMANV